MDHTERSLALPGQLGLLWVPIHSTGHETPVTICVLLREQPEASQSAFVVIREVAGATVFLGAICDAAGRVLEWVEVWVQEPALKDGAFSTHEKPLDNATFDARWQAEFARTIATIPNMVLVTGMEDKHPRPLLVKRATPSTAGLFAKVEPSPWLICTDDDLLKSLGLPSYSTSSYRYLHNPGHTGKKSLIATTSDTPINSHAQGPEQLLAAGDNQAIFNPFAGLVRVTRFSPLELEEYLRILEGGAWPGPVPPLTRLPQPGVYGALAEWSTGRKGMAFLLRQDEGFGQRLDEIFFLKLSALLGLVKTVRTYVKAHQLPLLALTPASFRVCLADVGDQFPALWTAKFQLVRPSQAYPLNIRFTEQKYFIRIGKIEPSPFLPEGLGAYSFGIGSIRIRQIIAKEEGVVVEGTLIAEDYLGLNPDDLLWFKLPLRDERLEFFAQTYSSEQVGPKEARFRTFPTAVSASVTATLKGAVGTAFQRSPFEICPLLSSPCDLFSLGVIGARILLANSRSNLPVILDEVLSLAQRVGKVAADTPSILAELKAIAARDSELLDLISPQALTESGDSPEQARGKLPMDLWLESIALLLRFFPGLGPHSFCRSLGEATPAALETIFDSPIGEMDNLLRRLRNLLLPSSAANDEISRVLLDELASIELPQI